MGKFQIQRIENIAHRDMLDMAEDEIDLLQYWNVIWREKWGILGLAIVVSLMTIVVVFNMTPIYRSTATLLIEANQANVVSIEEVYGIDSSRLEYYLTQFEILNSRQLAEDVITKLDLAKELREGVAQAGNGWDWSRWIPYLPPP